MIPPYSTSYWTGHVTFFALRRVVTYLNPRIVFSVPPGKQGVLHYSSAIVVDGGLAVVFYRYLLLIETYHKARTEFENNLKDLEQHDALAAVKAEALLTQLSELQVSDSDTSASFTATSCDFELIRSSTVCEAEGDDTLLACQPYDVTHDPLQLTSDIIPVGTSLT